MIGTLSEVIAHQRRKLEALGTMSCAELAERADVRSPVDKGSFRASWNASLGSPRAIYIDIAAGESGRGNTVESVSRSMRPGDTFYYVNGAPYGLLLEYGYSNQAPGGIVRVTAAEWQQIVNGVIGSLQ